jgi:hypothetical protein
VDGPHPKRLAEKYPDVKLVTVRPSDDDRDKAFAETQTSCGESQRAFDHGDSAPAVPVRPKRCVRPAAPECR